MAACGSNPTLQGRGVSHYGNKCMNLSYLWDCFHVLLIDSSTCKGLYLRFCQSRASSSPTSILSLCRSPFPVGSVTYQWSHDRCPVWAARANEEQHPEKKREIESITSVWMTSCTLIHFTDSRPVGPLLELDSLALMYVHTHKQNLFLDTWPDIRPYWGRAAVLSSSEGWS